MRTLSFFCLIACLMLTACLPRPTATGVSPADTPVQSPGAASPTPEVLPSEVPLPTSTLTPEPGQAIFLLPENAAGYYAALFENWQAETAGQGYGLVWRRQASLAAGDLGGTVRLVVAAPGVLAPDVLSSLAAGALQTHFIIFDQPGVSAGGNVSVVGPVRYDQQGFIAGYIAAVITDDWRIGVLSPTDTLAGQAASAGFLNGAVFFCGLCNPYFGPIVDYPLAVGRPSTAGSQEWVAAAQELLDQAVTTVFLGPGVQDPAVLALLQEKGVKLIGAQPMAAGMEASWVVSVLPDDRPARDLLPSILSGAQGQQIEFPVGITEINASLLSPGRQGAVVAVLADLLAGVIATGAEPAP